MRLYKLWKVTVIMVKLTICEHFSAIKPFLFKYFCSKLGSLSKRKLRQQLTFVIFMRQVCFYRGRSRLAKYKKQKTKKNVSNCKKLTVSGIVRLLSYVLTGFISGLLELKKIGKQFC